VAYLGFAGSHLGVEVAFDGGDALVDASRQREGGFAFFATDGADGPGASVLGSGSSLAETEGHDELFLVGFPGIT
jgi:hypothetical protein